MQKKMFGFGAAIIAAVAIGFWAGSGIADTSMTVPEGELVIKGKKPARFPHNNHLDMGLECGVCHHDAEHKPLTAEAIASLGDPGKLSCVSCHNSDNANTKLQKAKDVFHARCKDCHKAGYKGKKGPTKCSDCHLKKKKAVEGC